MTRTTVLGGLSALAQEGRARQHDAQADDPDQHEEERTMTDDLRDEHAKREEHDAEQSRKHVSVFAIREQKAERESGSENERDAREEQMVLAGVR